ncbi:glycerate kinase type-2 family protein [Billgrantia saliphila]|uniref:glycerate kinase type-2 family protein n=1 Tax=Billgrantia saliphila TaxID=1848458 RepID=UPI000CE4F5E0|nr:glycerate kinase [Halomonas saliphila]
MIPQLPPFDPELDVADWLRRLADIAVAAVHPDTLVADLLPDPPPGRTVVVGAGKAAAAMAAALERAWQERCPDAPLSGLVVTRYGHGADCDVIEVLEASHPMPDDLGEKAARRMLQAVEGLGEDDRVIALVSGGGSALMTLPAEGITLADKQATNRELLRCGAPIGQMNTVRRHLSAIKGGRLAAAAHPAQVVTWLISDIPGDVATQIASGPTLPDRSTPADALMVLERYAIEVPAHVRQHLERDTSAPSPDDEAFERDDSVILARAHDALEVARNVVEEAGVIVRVLGDDLEGEACELGRAQARMALEARDEIATPLLILSGGETSVTVRGDGRGGRNVEYLLGLFEALRGAPGIHALAIDTDGIDGSEDNAGALFSPDDWTRAKEQGLDPADYLSRNDAYTFFQALDRLIVTGPTRTNVNDFRAILVLPRTP